MSEEHATPGPSSSDEPSSHSAVRHAASAGLGLTSVLAAVVAISEYGLRATVLALAFAAIIVCLIWLWTTNKRLVGWRSFVLVGLALITGGAFVYEITRGPENPPPPPRAVGAKALSSTEIELFWRASSGEDGYRVYDELRGLVVELPAGTDMYTVSNLDPRTSYCFTVVAFRGANESEHSNEACFDTSTESGDQATGTEPQESPAPTSAPEVRPLPPTGVGVTTIDSTSVEVRWRDAAGGTESFRIYSRQGFIEELTMATQSHIVEGLRPDFEHCFYVTAVQGNVESEPSNLACATTVPVTSEETPEPASDDEPTGTPEIPVLVGNFGEEDTIFEASADGDFTVEYAENILQLRSIDLGPSQRKQLVTEQVPNDVLIDVKMRTPFDPATGSYWGTYLGVGCRWNDESGYRLEIDPEFQTAWLVRIDAGVRHQLATWEGVRSIAPGDGWQRVYMECANDTINAWINETWVGTIVDDTYPEGRVILEAGTFWTREDGRVAADFMDFEVWEQ